jgi:hypothetical protein
MVAAFLTSNDGPILYPLFVDRNDLPFSFSLSSHAYTRECRKRIFPSVRLRQFPSVWHRQSVSVNSQFLIISQTKQLFNLIIPHLFLALFICSVCVCVAVAVSTSASVIECQVNFHNQLLSWVLGF